MNEQKEQKGGPRKDILEAMVTKNEQISNPLIYL